MFQNVALVVIGLVVLIVVVPYFVSRLATSNKLNRSIKPISPPKLINQKFVPIEEEDVGPDLWQRQVKLEAESREKFKDNPAALAIYDQLGKSITR